MTLEEFTSRVRMSHPGASMAQIVSMINQALLEEPIFDTKSSFATISSVEDQRWYTLPDAVQQLLRVWYMDDEGEYQPIKELVGFIDTEDQT